MNFSYPKKEKLKARKKIEQLFKEGQSVSKYPLRLVYMPLSPSEHRNINLSVSVSKKYFKKAVDRNYFKRLLRETYRLNKHILIENLNQPYAIMFFYESKNRFSYQEIYNNTSLLFEKLIKKTL